MEQTFEFFFLRRSFAFKLRAKVKVGCLYHVEAQLLDCSLSVVGLPNIKFVEDWYGLDSHEGSSVRLGDVYFYQTGL